LTGDAPGVVVDVFDLKGLSRVDLGGEMELGVLLSGVEPAEMLWDGKERPNGSTRNGNWLVAHGVHRSRVRGLPTEKRSGQLSVA